MSQPIRYGLSDEHLGRIHPAKDGHLVMWADYAALAAENERLRKAGDAVTLCLCADTDEQHKRRCAINWLAAKEGRDAK